MGSTSLSPGLRDQNVTRDRLRPGHRVSLRVTVAGGRDRGLRPPRGRGGGGPSDSVRGRRKPRTGRPGSGAGRTVLSRRPAEAGAQL